VKPIIPHFEGQLPALAGPRLSVDQYFRLTGQERIFALGDVAGYVDSNEKQVEGKPPRSLPMLAQVAEAEARSVASNIIASIREKKLKEFHYRSKGSLVSVGQWFAIGEFFFFHTSGKLMWWIWRTVYLFKFASWKKRIHIGFEWTLDLFYPRDITKLN
jgi:NADH dehydrogenase